MIIVTYLLFSRSGVYFHAVQQLDIFVVKPNKKTAFADEIKTSTNAEIPLFARF